MLERSDAVTWLSLRNATQVHIVAVDQLNTYDVLASDDVVFTRAPTTRSSAAPLPRRGHGALVETPAARPAKAEASAERSRAPKARRPR